jgi:RNA polymerase sigma-70 factor (ECF subfamily)
MTTQDSAQDDSSQSPFYVGRRGTFDSTPWSVVIAAGEPGNASRRESLETLCSIYWTPLYVYVLRKVSDDHLAQDLTQSFFERLLAGKSLRLADPARGRFRTFLIKAFEWHLANEFREGRAAKRGGKIQLFSMNFPTAFTVMPDNKCLTAEAFEQQWARSLLSYALERLAAEQKTQENGEQFETLKKFLGGASSEGGYADACKILQVSESAARMAVSRLRGRFRELIREEILRTVTSVQDVDDEIRLLFRALSGR